MGYLTGRRIRRTDRHVVVVTTATPAKMSCCRDDTQQQFGDRLADIRHGYIKNVNIIFHQIYS